MNHTTQPQSPSPSSMTNDRNRATENGPRGRPYGRPRLVAITRDEALLEALGPAQANYGNGGFP